MSIFDFRNKLVENYKSFSQSFIRIAADDIKEKVDEVCNTEKHFWPDPLIQVNPFYKLGESISDLVKDGKLHPTIKKIFVKDSGKPLDLYTHQVQAIQLASEGKSFIVTTGTGSGKSLCFFIPIVNSILKSKEKEKQSGKGITKRTRAIVLYPMNALANSQKEEIEKFLKNYNPDNGIDIAVGRYTGQESEFERDELKRNPPDILLTNYMMLELILMRYSDREVVKNLKGLEFLVLDELHTYRGRQGSDVAMLLRRMRLQLAAKDMICIGTSATMSSVGDRKKQNKTVAEFATKLFGTSFDVNNVIAETLNPVTDRSTIFSESELLKAVQEALSHDFTIKNFDELKTNPLAIWFEQNVSITKTLMRSTPKTLDNFAEDLRTELKNKVDLETCKKVLTNFLELFNDDSALKTAEGRNPFPFKLHQFLSGPGKLYITLQAPGKREVTVEGQKYSSKTIKGKPIPLFEVYFCRHCGKEYIPVWISFNGQKLSQDGSNITKVSPRNINELPDSSEKSTFGYICLVDKEKNTTNAKNQRFYGGEDDLPSDWFDPKTGKVKADKKIEIPKKIKLDPFGQVSQEGEEFWLLPGRFTLCVNCLATHSGRGREQNRIVGLSGEGRSSVSTVLTLQMLREQFTNNDSSDAQGSNKVLGFSDNRQDAALQAGHFNDFINQLLVRSALLKVLQSEVKTFSLEELVDEICKTFSFGREKDTNNQELLKQGVSESLVNLRSANTAIRHIFSNRLLEDLNDRQLYTNPSMESLGLVKIDFNGLKELSENHKTFDRTEYLSLLSSKERYKVLRLLLDEARQRYCINSKYLDEEEQERQSSYSYNLLNPRWLQRKLIWSQGFYVGENDKKDGRKTKLVHFGTRSRLIRKLRLFDFWENYYGKNSELRKAPNKAMQALIAEMADILASKGYLYKKDEGQGTFYQINQNVIGWSYNREEIPENANPFFRGLYQNLARELDKDGQMLFKFEASEHTAQLTSEERKELEIRFRATKKDKEEWEEKHPSIPFERIPVLFCSPTMELGIDISSLNYVYMRNVPPTPANYVQRAGRAGRSGQQALSTTYCTALSPHDQWFFKHPEDMVQGVVEAPTLDLANESLIRNHLHSLWLSVATPDIKSSVAEVLDTKEETLPVNSELMNELRRATLTEEAIRQGKLLLISMQDFLKKEKWATESYVELVMGEAARKFDEAFNTWRDLYKSTQRQILLASQKLVDGATKADDRKAAEKRLMDASSQLKKLTQKSSSSNTEFYVYRYLASQGFLPGYNFPSLPMIAWVPAPKDQSGEEPTMLSRSRFLAISEFGPRNLIYHQGRIYRIEHLKLNITKGLETAGTYLPTTSMSICPNCGYGHQLSGIRIHNVCENCGQQLESEDIIDGLYQVNMVESKEVDRITILEENRRSHGFEMQTIYRFSEDPSSHRPLVSKLTITDSQGQIVARLTYSPSALIQRTNLGWRYRKNQKTKGFVINPMTGFWKNEGPDSLETNDDVTEEDKGPTQTIVPYVQDTRNILILEPIKDPKIPLLTKTTMATLQSALKQAIEKVYQIEPSEIFVEPLPDAKNRRLLLIYESGEGGAGVLYNLVNSKPGEEKSIQKVAEKALELMHYEKTGTEWSFDNLKDNKPDCIAGCYECLLTYFNQPEHEIIDRKDKAALSFLMALANNNKMVGEVEDSQKVVDKSTSLQTTLGDFLQFLTQKSLSTPDELPKRFKRLNLQFPAAYSGSRTCLTLSKLSTDDMEAMEEMAWTVIDISDPNEWEKIVAEHSDIFIPNN